MSDVINCEEEETVAAPTSMYGVAQPILSVKNHIYLYADIDDTISKLLIASLHEMAMTLINNSLENGCDIPAINLHICSGGGSCSDALGIIQCMKDIMSGNFNKLGGIPIPVQINTWIEGEADSAASLIACVGKKRYCSKYALSLIHDVRMITGGTADKVQDAEDRAENIKAFKKIFYDTYIEHSKLTEDKLTEICSHETYSKPDQLLEWGLIDEIV